MPSLNGVVETALYVRDLGRSVRFYKDIFRLESMMSDDRFCALNVAPGHVLLLFRQGATLTPVPTPGGVIPPHDGTGQLHMAFSISASSLKEWEQWMRERDVPIESRVDWPGGGRSLYLRDPDGHLVELATPGIWPNY